MFKKSTNQQEYLKCLAFLLSKNPNFAAEQKKVKKSTFILRDQKKKEYQIEDNTYFTFKLCGANCGVI